MSLTRRTVLALGAAATAGLAGCSSQPAGQPVQLSVESPWVRTTEGATMPDMSAAFMTLVNPGTADVRLVAASSPVAGMCQLHEMVKGSDGTIVMQEAPNGITVPAGAHVHLVPSGYHVMLMGLKEPLPVGAEVALELELSNGQRLSVKAPVKLFTEEEDHYHSQSPSPAPPRG